MFFNNFILVFSKSIISVACSLKIGLSTSLKLRIIWFIDSPLKIMKNAFYFMLKPLFVLRLFKFLSWLFDHVRKKAWLESWFQNSWRHTLVNKKLQYTYCAISNEVNYAENEKDMGLVSPPSFVYGFSRKLFLMLHSNWAICALKLLVNQTATS